MPFDEAINALATRVATEFNAIRTALSGKAAAVHSHAIGDLPVATSGTSNTTQVVRADDSRLSNARTPTSHTHATTDLTGVTATAAELNKLDGALPTVTEINYLDGVTSSIQTQINGKAATSHTHATTQITGLTATAAELNKLDGALPTVTEINYLDGVTSPIQTQINGKAPERAQGMELRESFTGMADGTPSTTSATEQAMTNYSVFAAAAPYVRSGFLSTLTPASAEAGSYRIAQLSGPVVRVGARFAFSSYTLTGGLLALSIQATSIATSAAVPISPMHFYLDPLGWNMDVNNVAGTAVESVASGTFSTPLTANGVDLHTVDIVLDRDRDQCHITLPTGQVVTLTDSRFSLAGTYVYVEPFKTAGSLSSKTNALVREWWADSRAIESLPVARSVAKTIFQSPTFANSWTNFGAPHQSAVFRKKSVDEVQILGLIRSGSIGAAAFTLPVGFRPPSDLYFATVSNGAFASLNITAGGAVIPVSGSNAWFSINCSFFVNPV